MLNLTYAQYGTVRNCYVSDIAEIATRVMIANATHVALCEEPTPDNIAVGSALSAHREALALLAAIPSRDLSDLHLKAMALATCLFRSRGYPVVLEGDCGLLESFIQDVINVCG